MKKLNILKTVFTFIIFVYIYHNCVNAQTLSFDKVSYDSNAFAYGNYLYNLLINDNPAPSFVDIDSDGDDDMFIGLSDGTINFYENTGDSANINWVQRVGSSNPANIISVSSNAVPRFADLNGDNLIDFLCGKSDGLIDYYPNVGSETSALFLSSEELSASGGSDVGTNSVPTVAFITPGNTLDILIGAENGEITFFLNEGTPNSYSFANTTGSAHPLDGIDFGMNSAPTMIDLDHNGTNDVIIGAENGSVICYNGGTFFKIATTSPFLDSIIGKKAKIGITDYDNDGDKDVFVGIESGIIRYYEDIQDHSNDSNAIFIERGMYAIGKHGVPEFIDYNGDNIIDLAKVRESGQISFYLGEKDKNGTLSFVRQMGSENPFDGIIVDDSSSLFVNDVDYDNDFDLLVFKDAGDVEYYENVTNNTSPMYVQVVTIANPFDGDDFGSNHTSSVDMDGDNDLDLVICQSTGAIKYFRNEGFAANPIFTEITGGSNPLGTFNCGVSALMAFGDYDFDGDPDAVLGINTGTLRYFENTGTATVAAFTEITGAGNPFNGLDVGSNAKPVALDYNSDGDIDIILSDEVGRLEYYENKINTALVVNDFPYYSVLVNEVINLAIDSTIVDPDVASNNDTLSLVATLSDGSPLPAFLTFNDSTQTFTGTPADSDSGSYAIIIVINDRFLNYDTLNFNLVINEGPIKVGSLQDQNWKTGDFSIYNYSNDVSYIDAHNLIYHVTSLGGSQTPQWFFFNPIQKRVLGDPNIAGSYTFVVKITDEYNAFVRDTFTINVTGPSIGVETNMDNEELILYPIPANNKLNIKTLQPGIISLYDMTGKLIYSEEIKNNYLEIQLNSFGAGNYFCIFENKNQRIIKQFIIED